MSKVIQSCRIFKSAMSCNRFAFSSIRRLACLASKCESIKKYAIGTMGNRSDMKFKISLSTFLTCKSAANIATGIPRRMGHFFKAAAAKYSSLRTSRKCMRLAGPLNLLIMLMIIAFASDSSIFMFALTSYLVLTIVDLVFVFNATREGC